MGLSLGSGLNFINFNNTVGANLCAIGASYACLGICHVGVVVTLTVHFAGKGQYFGWTGNNAKIASLAFFNVNLYCSSNFSHNSVVYDLLIRFYWVVTI